MLHTTTHPAVKAPSQKIVEYTAPTRVVETCLAVF